MRKWPKMALFGPKMALNGRKPLYFHIFVVEKTDFGNIKLSLGTKIRFLEIIYANSCEKWPKMALFGPKMALNGRKPLYFHIFGVQKTDFGNIKLSLGTKIRFLEIIYANLCEKWSKMALFLSKNGFKWLKTTVFPHFWGRENRFW